MPSDPNKALNIRDFPDDLRWKCKRVASDKRKTLREFVISVLRKAVEEEPRKK